MIGTNLRFAHPVISVLMMIIGVCALLVMGDVSVGDPRVKTQIVTYSQDVRPLLERHCVECHSGWFPDGGLRLDSIDAIFEGGNSGPAIVPGAPDKGWLMYSLSKDGKQRMQMPPAGERLSRQQVNLIREWIKQGAK